MDKEVKQESSIPVQARVSLITLAELVNYWEKEGYVIRTMSQEIAWSLDLLAQILRNNGVLPVTIESVADAHKHMEIRGLYQRSLKDRSFKKIGAAIRFENFREQGVNPKYETPTDYNILHNKGSIEPSPFVNSNLTDEEMRAIAWKKMQENRLAQQRRIYEESQKRKEAIAKDVEGMKARGMVADEPPNETVVKEGMSEEDFYNRQSEREEEEIKKLNAPIDMEFLKRNVAKV